MHCLNNEREKNKCNVIMEGEEEDEDESIIIEVDKSCHYLK